MRLAPILAASLVLTTLAAPALAQTPELDRLRLQTLQQQNMRAQEQSNIQHRRQADLDQALSEQQRRQTQANLQAAQSAAGTPGAATSQAAPAVVMTPGRIVSDDERMRQLQDRTLADSNARLRAITPAP